MQWLCYLSPMTKITMARFSHPATALPCLTMFSPWRPPPLQSRPGEDLPHLSRHGHCLFRANNIKRTLRTVLITNNNCSNFFQLPWPGLRLWPGNLDSCVLLSHLSFGNCMNFLSVPSVTLFLSHFYIFTLCFITSLFFLSFFHFYIFSLLFFLTFISSHFWFLAGRLHLSPASTCSCQVSASVKVIITIITIIYRVLF